METAPSQTKIWELGWGTGRELVGGKIHESIWVMKLRVFLKKWGRGQSKSVCYSSRYFTMLNHIRMNDKGGA